MGILDKIIFWKKKEEPLGAELGLGAEPGLPPEPKPAAEPGLPGEDNLGLDLGKPLPGETPPEQAPGMPQMPASQQPTALEEQQQYSQAATLAKDMEVISAKLDSIRATIENLNQRIMHIEKIAAESQHEEEKKPAW